MKLIILDRDGVINEDSEHFIKSPEEWIPIAGSLEAIARLNAAGYKVAVASNQSGIARGLFTRKTLDAMHQKMHTLLSGHGGHIDAVFYCPHGPDDGCDCRKPRPGLLEQAATQFNTSLEAVTVVGDSLRDIEAARAVGARVLLVRTGKGRHTEALAGLPGTVPVYDDLASAVDAILGNSE